MHVFLVMKNIICQRT